MKDKRPHRKPAPCSFHSSSWDHIIGSPGSDGENEQYVVKDIVKFNSINLETNSMIADCPLLCSKSEKMSKKVHGHRRYILAYCRRDGRIY